MAESPHQTAAPLPAGTPMPDANGDASQEVLAPASAPMADSAIAAEAPSAATLAAEEVAMPADEGTAKVALTAAPAAAVLVNATELDGDDASPASPSAPAVAPAAETPELC